ncbi:MAG: hypothetical protein QF890_13035 [Myxococcota bacterium]|nr:hypothetical protein [Deltaproteobacteria bacterium]MCP4239398.1 hypothetical protein [bacterium]MDP6075659.1 hypothetical protein [Myxococcota bacterium]MDP6243045.1 hypothetical protein [Myxococcota bacterium]MDP7075403.1 hypothetical protein [Myxococcota bacterium]
MSPRALAGPLLVLVVTVLTGCASDLVVRAPDTVVAPRPSPLADLAPLTISIGPVEGAPDPREAVGERGGAFLQPGGPIYLTEAPARAVRRLVEETLSSSGHRVVPDGAEVHVALRLLEFRVDAPRDGAIWDVVARVGVSLRVSAAPGDEAWEELHSSSERSRRVAWRPGNTSVEAVLRACLDDLAVVLASRDEFAAALATRARDRG